MSRAGKDGQQLDNACVKDAGFKICQSIRPKILISVAAWHNARGRVEIVAGKRYDLP